jgi:predicted RNase H-like HicB family nuclease
MALKETLLRALGQDPLSPSGWEFVIEVWQLEEYKFTARCADFPDLPASVGATEDEAVEALAEAISERLAGDFQT